MNIRIGFTHTIGLAIVFAALLTNTAHADAGAEPHRQVSVMPSVGLADGETLRVNFLNVGSRPFEIDPCMFDADGEHIKTGDTVTILPGQTRSFDLSFAEAATRGGGPTVQVRAAVHIDESDLASLATSGEVIDDVTGKSSLFVPGATNPPDPVHPGEQSPPDPVLPGETAPPEPIRAEVTRSAAPVGITFGQTLRISFINVGDNPIELDPCIFDRDGEHLKTGAPVSLAPGQTVSFEMSRAEVNVGVEPRLLVRGAAHVRNPDARHLFVTGEVVDESTGRSALFLPGAINPPDPVKQ